MPPTVFSLAAAQTSDNYHQCKAVQAFLVGKHRLVKFYRKDTGNIKIVRIFS